MTRAETKRRVFSPSSSFPSAKKSKADNWSGSETRLTSARNATSERGEKKPVFVSFRPD